jgi:branched-chain amino acid transport system permease protein
MEKFVALAFSGLASGAIVALAAIGLLLLYKASGIVNFAHGDLITLGAYLAFWLIDDIGLPTVAGYAGAVGLMFGVGVAMERLAVAPLRGKSLHVVVIATLGLALSIRSLIALWHGTDTKRLPSPVEGDTSTILGATISHQRFLIVLVAAAVVVLLVWFFGSTAAGRQLRALAVDRDMARLLGVRAGVMSMIGFGLSAALAAIAGVLIGPLGGVEITLGFGVMVNSFAAMVMGGFGSLWGVAIAGLMIGMVERLLGGYVLVEYSSSFPYVLMLVVIALRPQGLFGKREHASRF